MSEKKITHTPKPLSEYFQLSYEIAETLGSVLHRGMSNEDDRPVSVWVSKLPVELKSFDAHHALQHLHNIDQIDPPVASSEMYGVDAEGYFFIVFKSNVQDNIGSQRGTISEMERRYFKTVRLVHKVHEQGAFFGDLNPASFWLNSKSELELTGLNKLPAANRDKLIAKTADELLVFSAPEVLDGQTPDKKSDVYSLGLIGFYLLCNQLPLKTEVVKESVEILQNNSFKSSLGLSRAVLDVLYKAISEEPEERYESAEALVSAMIAAHEQTAEQGTKFTQSTRDSGISSLPAIRRVKNREVVETNEKDLADKFVNRGYKLVLYAVTTCILLSLAAGIYFYRQYQEKVAEEVKLATEPFTGGNPELKSAVARISDLSADSQAKLSEIKKLVNSSDPLAYNLLIASLRGSSESVVRKAAISGIITRIENSGSKRAGKQLEQWLKYSRKTSEDKVYIDILKALDPVAPKDQQVKLLNELSAADSNIATRLTAALFFDKNKDVLYQGLLAEQIGKSFSLRNAKDLSGQALILYNEALTQIFAEDIASNISSFTERDVRALLPVVAKRADYSFKQLLKFAANQDYFTKAAKYFINLVLNKSDLENTNAQNLIAIALGEEKNDDLTSLFSWREPESEKALFLSLATINDSDLRKLVMDNLSIRNLKAQPAAGMLRWLRENDWQNRAAYTKSFGVIANSEDFSEAEVRTAFKTFAKYIGDDTLQSAILESSDDRILNLLLRNYSNELSLIQKVQLLNHKSALVREKVITKIKTNDVGAMKLITASYQKESSERIKAMYRKQFWFIKK